MKKIKNYEIIVEVDRSCQMARVSCKGLEGMEGNFWDFHPGCHGIEQYGDFRGYSSLANAMFKYLVKEKKVPADRVNIIEKSYTFS